MNIHTVYQREYDDLKTEIDKKNQTICSSGQFILGKEVEGFEKEFARYLGVKHVVGVGNGMEALQIGMMACGIGTGDEVITTPLSAVASTLAITTLGARPIFVDIDKYFHLDADMLEKRITKKTKAILPVHLYGQAVDMDTVRTIAKNHGLMIFEDACQAHGAGYKKIKTGGNKPFGRLRTVQGTESNKLGTMGTFGAFSFYPTKNLGCYGDGGAIATNDRVFFEKCKILRNYGQKDRYEHRYCGVNSRLDEMQAGILRVKLTHLDSWNARRSDIAVYYDKAFEGLGDIEIPKNRNHATHIYHQYVIRTQKRDALKKWLQKHSITALIHYPIPIHKQPCYRQLNALSFPEVERTCREILSIPIHPYMKDDEVNRIIEIINKFFK